MRVLIVHAHPERQSFNAALTDAARQALTHRGHEVVVSDLYAMGWDPVSDRRNFTSVADPDRFRQQREEVHAAAVDGFAADVRGELDKLLACELLILQFPLWWFGLPAILKGWVDRVFAMGPVYGRGAWYDRGTFAGRRALLSVTTGSPATSFSPRGLHGFIDDVLFPINHGVLRFTGFDVLRPQISWAPAHADDTVRRAMLAAYADRLAGVSAEPPIDYPPLDAFDPVTFDRPA